MNTLNRVVIVILLLVAVVVCTLSLVMPTRVLTTITQQSDLLVDFLSRLRPVVRVTLGIIFALTLDLILLLAILFEVRRPRPKKIQVKETSGGEVTMNAASIADRLEYEIDMLPGALQSKPKVSAKRGGVVIEVDVEMAAELNAPQQAERIVQTTQNVVEQEMGLELAHPPKINLRAVRQPKAPKKREKRPHVSEETADAETEAEEGIISLPEAS